MLQVKAMKDVTTGTRLGGKLDKKRREEVSTILLIEVPEVEIEVSNRPWSRFAYLLDVLNDCRATRQRKSVSLLQSVERGLTKGCSSRSRLRTRMVVSPDPETDLGEHTLAIDPQERASGFPFRKYSTAKEPLSRTIVLDAASDGVIR